MRQKFTLTNKRSGTVIRCRHIEKVHNIMRRDGMGNLIPNLTNMLNDPTKTSVLLVNHKAYYELTRKYVA